MLLIRIVQITTNSIIQKNLKKNKMENTKNTIEPESKKLNDLTKLIIGIIIVIIALVAIKYLGNALGIL